MSNDANNPKSPDPGFLDVLLSLRNHCDDVMWGRVQNLGLIQGGAIAGAYTLRHRPEFSLGIFVFALVLTFLLLFMMRRDAVHRDANDDLIRALGEALRESSLGAQAPHFKLSGDPPPWKLFKVGYLNSLVFVLFIALDAGGILYFLLT